MRDIGSIITLTELEKEECEYGGQLGDRYIYTSDRVGYILEKMGGWKV